MPRASRKPMSESVTLELQDNFSLLISFLSTSRDIKEFFETFLTPEEKTMLTKRLMLHLMLENNYSGLEIATVLGLSRETVRVHKGVWTASSAMYKTLIAKLAKQRKANEFWRRVETLLRPAEYALRAKSNMKARAKLASGDF